MTVLEQVNAILKEIKPTKNLESVPDIIEGGYLDSFELLNLINLVSFRFSIEIGSDEIVPENFNSAAAIADMVDRLKSEK